MTVDLYHYMGSDLSISPTGDLAIVSGVVYGQQRIIRRLLTNPGDYIWHNDYGGGVGLIIGNPTSALAIQGVIRGQISKEAAVAPSPAATVDVVGNVLGTTAATITYTDAGTGESQVLTVPSIG